MNRVSGKDPKLFFADHSRSERLRIHRLDREIDKVVRSRMLNPRWIEGMKQHGYKGAFDTNGYLSSGICPTKHVILRLYPSFLRFSGELYLPQNFEHREMAADAIILERGRVKGGQNWF